MIGAALGPYRVLEKLGAGGMGEVYRARDTRLNRDVAIKVLPSSFADDADRRARFEREARAVAALSHPNILAIFDTGVVTDAAGLKSGPTYVVTELLEGETVRDRLQAGALPVKKAVDIAVQIARGLAAAHDKHLVHRDLKPENVFLLKDGQVKILDFGLARQAAADSGATETVAAITDPGIVMGTVGYMAPEQVRGQAVDARADLFALGLVLYEMLTGQCAFHRDTAAETMTAILREDPPDLAAARADLPPALDRTVRHCLEKNPAERFQSARDVAFALEAFSGTHGSSGASAAAAAPRRRRWLRPAVLAVAIIATFALGVAIDRRLASGTAAALPVFEQRSFERHQIFSARFGPDGRTIFFDAALEGNLPQIFKLGPDTVLPQPLGSPRTHLLSVSSKGELAVLTDVRALAGRLFSGRLERMTPEGQTTPWMSDVREADWSPDGDTLAIVHVVGSTDKLEYPPGNVLYKSEGYLSDLRVSPDGSRVAFMEHPMKWDDRGPVRVVNRGGGPAITLAGKDREYWGEQSLAWSPDGNIVYFSASPMPGRDYVPWAVPSSGASPPRQVWSGAGLVYTEDISRVDGRWLVTRHDWRSSIRALTPGASEEREFSWANNVWSPFLSSNGPTMLFQDSSAEAGLDYWVRIRATDGLPPKPPLGPGWPCGFAPNGQWALAIVPSSNRLMKYTTGVGVPAEVDRGQLERLSSAGWIDDTHVWICGSEKGRTARCYTQNLAGGTLTPLTPEGLDVALVSPDGKFMAVGSGELDGGTRVMTIPGGDPKPIRGLLAHDRVRAWASNSKALLVQADGLPAGLERVDLATGARTHIRTISPLDRAGLVQLWVNSVLDDGRFYAYNYRRELATLYVVTGCQWETMKAPCR